MPCHAERFCKAERFRGFLQVVCVLMMLIPTVGLSEVTSGGTNDSAPPSVERLLDAVALLGTAEQQDTAADQLRVFPNQLNAVVGQAELEVTVAIPLADAVEVVLSSDNPEVIRPASQQTEQVRVQFTADGATWQKIRWQVGRAGIATIRSSNTAGLVDFELPVTVAAGAVQFSLPDLHTMPGLIAPVIASIPKGSNDTREVRIALSTGDEKVATLGVTGLKSSTLLFKAGGPNTQTVNIATNNIGKAEITTTNDAGLTDAVLPVEAVKAFSFIHVSDCHDDCDSNSGKLRRTFDHINSTGGGGAFIVATGDSEPPDDVEDDINAKFGSLHSYQTMGNHNMGDLDWYHDRFDDLHDIVREGPPGCEKTSYAWEYSNAHCVCLNEYWDEVSEIGDDGNVKSELRDWLDDDLDDTSKWKFIFGHEPAYPQVDDDYGDGRHMDDSLNAHEGSRNEFWDILEDRDAVAYFCGHTHRFSKYLKDGVWQVNTARPNSDTKYDTYIRVIVGSETVTFHAYRKIDGTNFILRHQWTYYGSSADPVIKQQPVGITQCAGGTASFSVVAEGPGTLSYQWRKNGANLGNGGRFSGCTSPTMTITGTDPSDTGGYSCYVSCSGGTVTSSTATLTVRQTTAITQHPVAVTVCPNHTATFSASAVGVSLSYQWQVNPGSGFVNISGANGTAYTTPALNTGHNGQQYRVVVAGTCGTVTSAAALLTVRPSTAITQNPVAVVICPAESATFTAAASGLNLSYRWQADAGSGFADIPGATSTTYTTAPLSVQESGVQFRMVATGECGVATSAAAAVTVRASTVITAPPSDLIACAGQTATFQVSAAGSNLNYQWQLNSGGQFVDIDGAVADTYTTATLTIQQDQSEYRVIVSGDCGQVISQPATLTVRPDTVIIQQPQPLNLCTGADVTFSTAATGFGTLSYQWQKDQQPLANDGRITGADTPTLHITTAILSDAGQYRCVVSGECPSAISDEAALILEATTAITAQPLPYNACTDYPARFAVQAVGPQLAYEWQVSDGAGFSDIPAANQPQYTTPATTIADDGKQFRCIVSGPCGTVVSDAVILSVTPGSVGSYAVTDLGTLGGSESQALDLNSSGDVVGWSYIAGDTARHAFLYRDGIMHDLGTLGGSDSIAYDVNNDGTVVGWAMNGDGARRAFRYQQGTMSDLGTLGGTASEAYAINDVGTIAGGANLPGDAVQHAFRLDGEVMTDLDPLASSMSQARCINENGWVAGGMTFGATGFHAFRFDGTTLLDLTTFGGAESMAYRISAAGQVVGSAQTAEGAWQAYIANGEVKNNIGTLGGSNSSAEGINDAAAVVGWSMLADNQSRRAMLYRFGTRYDLNSMIAPCPPWVLESAQAVNTVGQIAGFGTIDGMKHAFLLTPNPAPLQVLAQPQEVVTCPGATASFSVTAAGSGTISYRWQKDRVNLVDNAQFSGTTTPTLTIIGVGPAELGGYRCLVSIGANKIHTRSAALSLAGQMAITQQPESLQTCRRYPVTVSVSASGPIQNYQWQASYGGEFQDIPGANAAVFQSWPLEHSDNGIQLRCVLTGPCGQLISTPATIAVVEMDTSKSNVVVDLGTLGGSESRAYDINHFGVVVGDSQTADGQTHAFVYKDGRMIDLGTLGGLESHATAINSAGHVAGWSTLPDGTRHAFLYDGTELHDLGTLGGSNSQASSINNASQLVGWSDLAGDAGQGSFLSTSGPLSAISLSLGGTETQAISNNDNGRIVGRSRTATGAWHAFHFDGYELFDIGTLGGTESVANSINSANQTVGKAQLPDGTWQAFMYSGGAINNLGTLGGSNSCANDLSSTAQVVGWSDLPGDTVQHAFMYRFGTRTDLNAVIPACPHWELHSAQAINNRGQIAGFGTIDGQTHAFVITPVIAGDFDRDGDIDQGDLSTLRACFSGASTPHATECQESDLDNDGDVDLADFGRLQKCVSGANAIINANCVN